MRSKLFLLIRGKILRYSLVTKSMTNYVNFFKSYIPESVDVKDVNKVINN